VGEAGEGKGGRETLAIDPWRGGGGGGGSVFEIRLGLSRGSL
jgi:hypothetical protein